MTLISLDETHPTNKTTNPKWHDFFPKKGEWFWTFRWFQKFLQRTSTGTMDVSKFFVCSNVFWRWRHSENCWQSNLSIHQERMNIWWLKQCNKHNEKKPDNFHQFSSQLAGDSQIANLRSFFVQHLMTPYVCFCFFSENMVYTNWNYFYALLSPKKPGLQDGGPPTIAINGVTLTPINGRKSMGHWILSTSLRKERFFFWALRRNRGIEESEVVYLARGCGNNGRMQIYGQ